MLAKEHGVITPGNLSDSSFEVSRGSSSRGLFVGLDTTQSNQQGLIGLGMVRWAFLKVREKFSFIIRWIGPHSTWPACPEIHLLEAKASFGSFMSGKWSWAYLYLVSCNQILLLLFRGSAEIQQWGQWDRSCFKWARGASETPVLLPNWMVLTQYCRRSDIGGVHIHIQNWLLMALV